jgi:death on curing protein
MPEFLTVGDVLELHALQVQRYGGSDGIRDGGLFESALAQPEAKFGGEYLQQQIAEFFRAHAE